MLLINENWSNSNRNNDHNRILRILTRPILVLHNTDHISSIHTIDNLRYVINDINKSNKTSIDDIRININMGTPD